MNNFANWHVVPCAFKDKELAKAVGSHCRVRDERDALWKSNHALKVILPPD
jgi:hypothetical protein